MEFWDTPIFALLCLEYPDLTWSQPTADVVRWGGQVVRTITTGPLVTL
ncbi:u-spanin [Arthrobacter phage SWEP2]|uniref:U-spanin n=1 Tax=Arthrobacter phage SWEP2 TaxID=2945958 RepID=A0A9E7MI70_9CAUD|nr:u-spanin [Arthrobacter phage SWEP2]